MKNEEKKSLFERLTGGNKEKKKSCCCNFKVEEIPEENCNKENKETPKKENGNCSCK